jgi:hypothetical protein
MTGVTLDECYLIKLSIWDREIREIMDGERTDSTSKEVNWIN